MVLEIAIRNIALITELRLELGAGLNVLTGETGAGKSIVVDALTLVLGSKVDKSIVRAGEDKARVEALFDISGNRLAQEILEEWGVENDDGVIVVARELTATGRTVCRVGGTTVPLNQFRQLTSVLVELHGQHEHQMLFDSESHLGFLDAFGDEEHHLLMKKVEEDYSTYSGIQRNIHSLEVDLAERERLRDTLTYQLQEIQNVNPKKNEVEILEKKDRMLQSAQKISQKINRAYDLIYRGTGRGISAQEALKKASDAVAALSGLDEKFDTLRSRLDELFYAAQDIGYELQDMCETIDFDAGESERIASRLSDLRMLLRKYGPELEDVFAFRDKAQARLEEIDGGDEKLRNLQKDLQKVKDSLEEHCHALRESREQLAQKMCARILEELADLGMGRAKFEVRFENLGPGKFSPRGSEKAQFMLSANPGIPVRPLSEVASGGELSRIMLAMKVVAADRAGADAMVFDEIDTGVSGRMAQAIGEKLASIARTRQVICVSHLPQIAAMSDNQYLVEKYVKDGVTGSTVRLLSYDGRIEELARMVGGAEDIDSARKHACNMLEAARAGKKRLMESNSETAFAKTSLQAEQSETQIESAEAALQPET